MDTPLYPRNHSPALTPAEKGLSLEAENAILQMRVAVLSEALRAAEEELTTRRFDAPEQPAALPPHNTLHGIFNKRNTCD